MIWLFIALGVIAYLVMAGAAFNLVELNHRKRCKPPSYRNACDKQLRGSKCAGDIDFSWYVSAIAWPFILPVSLGLLATKNGLPSKENRRAKELAAKEHEVALAKLEMEKRELEPY